MGRNLGEASGWRGDHIFTDLPRVAYYADGNFEYVNLSQTTLAEVKTSMKERKAVYLIVGEQDISEAPETVQSLQRDFIEVIRFGQDGMEKIIIYRIVHG